MQLRLFNSLSRQLEDFVPLDRDRVTMYSCGPTVYNYIHIGNARPAVVFSLLARLLRRLYPHVVYARNVTDVDDKINAAAKAQGVAIEAITSRFAEAHRQDMLALGVDPPDVEPKATAHIDQIIAMCTTLIDGGHAYVAEGHVLFAVDSFAEYGQLSRRSTDEMLAGARVDVAPYKRGPGDFVLWKPSTPDLPGWDSPWGRGRPGWHIECSAMAATHLGETIDIHAGGIDLQFPHHENEIAQSVCAHGGRTFARYWLHNGLLNLGGRKMSKSIGNITLVHELLQRYPAEALRYVLLSAQYRQPLDWSEQAVDRAVATLRRLYRTLEDLGDDGAADNDTPPPDAIMAALCDDLGTPEALAQLAGIAADARKARTADDKRRFRAELLAGGALLGLLQNPAGMSVDGSSDAGLPDDAIQQLVDERIQAKAARDFARADAIRTELAQHNVVIEDTPAGVRWRRQ